MIITALPQRGNEQEVVISSSLHTLLGRAGNTSQLSVVSCIHVTVYIEVLLCWLIATAVVILSSQNGDISSVPEIGGSSAGFIALVVVLSIIIVLSCVGVFFLLRNHQSTSRERRTRSARTGKDRSLPLGPPGLRNRVAGLFGKRGGWIRANDDDEWDAEDDLSTHHNPQDAAFMDEYPQHARSERSMTSESVELTVPSLSFSHPMSSPPTTARVSESPLQDDDDLIASPSLDGHTTRDERHFSVQSVDSHTSSTTILSMQKFESGTKFKEGLDF